MITFAWLFIYPAKIEIQMKFFICIFIFKQACKSNCVGGDGKAWLFNSRLSQSTNPGKRYVN